MPQHPEAISSPDPPKSQAWDQQALGPEKASLPMWPETALGVLCVFHPEVT